MDEENKIPNDFLPLGSKEFIQECKVCNRYLAEEGNQYVMEKAVKKFKDIDAKETLFEYAICMDCATNMRGSLSEESKKHIEDFFTSDEVRMNTARVMQSAFFENESTLNYCIITGKSINDVNEYQIIAHCEGKGLFPGSKAFMVSDDGIEAISELLSESTKDELDGFRDAHFGVPPEFERILNPTDLLFC